MPAKSEAPINEFNITRIFNAPRELVWKAHTQKDHLKHWWYAKGLQWAGGTLDLQVGGVFHYHLKTPAGDHIYGRFVYVEINPPEKLVYVLSFSDSTGNITKHPMAPDWPNETLITVTFTENDGKTTLHLRGVPINATDLEIETFKAGFDSMTTGYGGTYDQLETHLAKL